MSKKNKKSKSLKLAKKIKSLEIELRELRSDVKKLKLSSGRRRQGKSKEAKVLAREPTLKIATPVSAKAEISPAVSSEKEGIAARAVGRN
jgi:hypothetical protein